MQDAIVVSQVVLWAVVLVNLILTLALVRRVGSPSTAGMRSLVGLKPGEDAPDWEARDLQGRTVRLSDFASRPTALLFVDAGCRPCKEQLPVYVELAPQAEAAGVNMVLVSGGTEDSTRDFLGRHADALRVVLAPRGESDLFERYRVPATPHFAFIEAGKVRVSGPSTDTYKAWRELTAAWRSAVASLIPSRA